jgi:ribonuclease T2
MNTIISGLLYFMLPSLLSCSVSNSSTHEVVLAEQQIADLYVFAYIWEPESCYKNPTWTQCDDPQVFWGTNFVIHGLWPQYSSNGYPSDCTEESFDETVIDEIGLEDMNHYWPNVKSEPTDADYDSFWQHEWTKHGTCSPLSQLDYFNTTLNLGKTFGTPIVITDNVGKNIPTSYIRDAFGGDNMVSLQCEGGNYLSGAFTCWSISPTDGSPDKQIVCPTDVHGEDNCSDKINIPSFT